MSMRACAAARRAVATLVAHTAKMGWPANSTRRSARIGSSRWIGPTVVDTRDVGRREHGHDAGHCQHGSEIDVLDRSVRMRAHAHGRMQQSARLGQVVGVGRLAGDVQRRRIMRHRRADDRRCVEWRVRCVHRSIATSGDSTRVGVGSAAPVS
jgi:hypothetical protein